jgi:hypothetical protein
MFGADRRLIVLRVIVQTPVQPIFPMVGASKVVN